MRKILAVMMLMGLIVSLAACGTQPQSTSGGAASGSGQPAAAPAATPEAKSATPSSAPSQPAKPAAEAKPALKFPEREIELIVFANPGGGFDVYARGLAPYLAKHLGNDAKVVVRNMPGADGKVAAKYVDRAKPDGHTIGTFSIPGLAVGQITDDSFGVDLTKWTWLGVVNQGEYATFVRAESAYKSVAELRGKKVKIGTDGLSSSSGLTLAVINAEMNLGLQIVPFTGSQEAAVAALRGDVEGIHYPWESMRSFIEDGKLRPLVVYSNTKPALLGGVQTVVEAGYPGLAESLTNNWTYGAPAGLPPEITQRWREVFWKAMNDPEFRAWAAKSKRSVNPQNGEATQKLVSSAVSSFGKYKDMIMQLQKGS